MPTTRLTEKLSLLVNGQLPEFIQADFPTFVAFLEAYYEYLEQDGYAQELLQNARSYSDIDRTVDSFVEYFIKQYCNDIPRNLLADKKLLVKHISDLYNTKGSQKSYKLLFRLLFNKGIDFYYPSTNILKASDGKWVQQVSIFVKTIIGDPNTIVGRTGRVITNNTETPIFIERKKSVRVLENNVDVVSTNIFEFIIDNSNNVNVGIGDIIEYGGYRGEVVPASTSVKVASSGIGFKPGDIFTLNVGEGFGATIKVTRTTSTGVILGVQLIHFGVNYTSDFYFPITSRPLAPSGKSFLYTGGTATIVEAPLMTSDSGYVNISDYSVSAFEGSYSGRILTYFASSGDVGTTSTNNSTNDLGYDAYIEVKLGSKAYYPGYYKTNDGFLSDIMNLEDADYYQPFSYVVKVDQQLDAYKKVVLDILHPAGTKLIGDYTITNDFNLSTLITTTIRYLTSVYTEIIAITDTLDYKNTTKVVNDYLVTNEADIKTIEKVLDVDFIDLTDILLRTFSRPLTDEVTMEMTDATKVINKSFYNVGIYAIDYFDPTEEDYVRDIEAVVAEDLLPVMTVDTIYEDSVNATESLEYFRYGYINNTLTDTITPGDSGSTLYTNYALASDYFVITSDADSYVGTKTTF